MVRSYYFGSKEIAVNQLLVERIGSGVEKSLCLKAMNLFLRSAT